MRDVVQKIIATESEVVAGTRQGLHQCLENNYTQLDQS